MKILTNFGAAPELPIEATALINDLLGVLEPEPR